MTVCDVPERTLVFNHGSVMKTKMCSTNSQKAETVHSRAAFKQDLQTRVAVRITYQTRIQRGEKWQRNAFYNKPATLFKILIVDRWWILTFTEFKWRVLSSYFAQHQFCNTKILQMHWKVYTQRKYKIKIQNSSDWQYSTCYVVTFN